VYFGCLCPKRGEGFVLKKHLAERPFPAWGNAFSLVLPKFNLKAHDGQTSAPEIRGIGPIYGRGCSGIDTQLGIRN